MQVLGVSRGNLPLQLGGKKTAKSSNQPTSLQPDTFVRCQPKTPPATKPAIQTVAFSGHNELHTAAAKGDLKEIHALLRQNKDIDFLNEQDAEGNTPFMVAAREGQFNAVQVLSGRRGIDRMLCNFEGKDAYDLAFERGHRQVATFINGKIGIGCPMSLKTGINLLVN